MNELVSVIIPAYNVSQYITKAIDSVLNQTYNAVEVIVIDDGSTDDTWDVIKQYEQISDRVKIYHQENSGVSSARNNALKRCNASWVMFLDGDDWLEENAVELLISIAREYPKKLICCDRYFAYEDMTTGIKKVDQSIGKYKADIDRVEALENTGTGLYSLQSSCYKIFNMEKLSQLKLQFDDDIFYGEDGLFVFRYIYNCDGIVFVPKPLWCILERPGSATQSKYNNKWLTMIEAVERMMSIQGLNDNVIAALEKYKAQRILIAFKGYLKGNNLSNDDYKHLVGKTKEALKKFSEWKDDSNIKIQLVIMLLPEALLKMVFQLREYKKER